MSESPVNHHDHERIVELTVVPVRFEADAMVAHLKSEGIDASVSGDDGNGLQPYRGLTAGYRVLVFENDLDTAQAIIANEDGP